MIIRLAPWSLPAALAAGMLTLSGCGLKGDLYLPEADAAPTATGAPVPVAEDDEASDRAAD